MDPDHSPGPVSADGLQIERTALAWSRTAIGVGAVSLIATRIDSPSLAGTICLAGLVCSAAMLLAARRRVRRIDSDLYLEAVQPALFSTAVTVLFVCVLASLAATGVSR